MLGSYWKCRDLEDCINLRSVLFNSTALRPECGAIAVYIFNRQLALWMHFVRSAGYLELIAACMSSFLFGI